MGCMCVTSGAAAVVARVRRVLLCSQPWQPRCGTRTSVCTVFCRDVGWIGRCLSRLLIVLSLCVGPAGKQLSLTRMAGACLLVCPKA